MQAKPLIFSNYNSLRIHQVQKGDNFGVEELQLIFMDVDCARFGDI
jgi:hypothetical protein